MRGHVLSLSTFRKGGDSALDTPTDHDRGSVLLHGAHVFWRLLPVLAILSSLVRKADPEVTQPHAGLRIWGSSVWCCWEWLDPEATHSFLGVEVELGCLLGEEMGWLISWLEFMSCTSYWWAQRLAPLWLHKGNPMFHCSDKRED